MAKFARWIAAALIAVTGLAQGESVDIDEVRFESAVVLADRQLVLNGAGLRTRFGFRVYAAGLYVPERSNSAAVLIGQVGPRRMAITMLREVEAETFAKSFASGLENNLSEAALLTLKDRIAQFDAIVRAGGTVKKGDVILIDFDSDDMTRIAINGQARGDPIKGADFYSAILKIWLGEDPADSRLKKALIGSG